MKRLMMVVLGMVCAVAVAYGAGEVVSENVVGFITVSVGAGEYALVCGQFDDMDTASPTVADVLGTAVPDSTVVYVYNGTNYDEEQYIDGLGWDPGTTVLDRDVGFWVYSPVAHDFVLQGEAPEYDTPISLGAGYTLMGYPYPAGQAIDDTVLGQTAGDSDVIYLYNGTNYDEYQYIDGLGWDPSDLVFPEGGAFWYFKASSGTRDITETVPYDLDS
jgi:hypothetical protein